MELHAVPMGRDEQEERASLQIQRAKRGVVMRDSLSKEESGWVGLRGLWAQV